MRVLAAAEAEATLKIEREKREERERLAEAERQRQVEEARLKAERETEAMRSFERRRLTQEQERQARIDRERARRRQAETEREALAVARTREDELRLKARMEERARRVEEARLKAWEEGRKRMVARRRAEEARREAARLRALQEKELAEERALAERRAREAKEAERLRVLAAAEVEAVRIIGQERESETSWGPKRLVGRISGTEILSDSGVKVELGDLQDPDKKSLMLTQRGASKADVIMGGLKPVNWSKKTIVCVKRLLSELKRSAPELIRFPRRAPYKLDQIKFERRSNPFYINFENVLKARDQKFVRAIYKGIELKGHKVKGLIARKLCNHQALLGKIQKMNLLLATTVRFITLEGLRFPRRSPFSS